MSTTLLHLRDEAEWLEKRQGTIGGSDAAAVLGISPWKSNVDLWEELKGLRKPKDISDNPAVDFGKKAEEHIRELFKLANPVIQVEYEPCNMWLNDRYPWAHASLDGWLTDIDGRRGILEIKTGTYGYKWYQQIPDHYYAQVIHYMMVTEADFGVVTAFLQMPGTQGSYRMLTYSVKRDQEQIEYLAKEEKEFFESLERNERPALLLPEI